MVVAIAVAVSGGVAVPVAVPVAGLTKRFFNQKDFLINVWDYSETLVFNPEIRVSRLATSKSSEKLFHTNQLTYHYHRRVSLQNVALICPNRISRRCLFRRRKNRLIR